MVSTMAIFHQLLELTDQLISIMKEEHQLITDTMDAIFEERGRLMEQLQEVLQSASTVESYRLIYDSLVTKEEELRQLLQNSLDETKEKMNQSKNVQTATKQYGSYYQHVSNGVFVDKSR